MRVKLLSAAARLPTRGSEKSAGLDLYACMDEEIIIAPGETRQVKTGISIELPKNTGGFIFARSGIAVKNGIIPANAVGVIDEDYRGEIIVALCNYSKSQFKVKSGDRIAQLVIMPVLYEGVEAAGAEDLSETERGSGGFGSTGR